MAEPDDLRKYVAPQLNEARLSRQWAAIEHRLPSSAPQRKRPLTWVTAGLAVCGACLALWYGAEHLRRTGPASPFDGSMVTADASPVSVELTDGSRVTLESHAQIAMDAASSRSVNVRLTRGRAAFRVAKLPERSFEVHAGPVEVRVVGTRFAVARTPMSHGERIEIVVEEGLVRVTRNDRGEPPRLLHAGEQLTLDTGSAPSAQPAEAPRETIDLADATVAAPRAEAIEGDAGQARATEPAETPRTLERAQRRTRHARSDEKEVLGREDARSLLEQANLTRRAGQLREAAALYQALTERYARDPRAGLAAFELGRIRMDSFADMRGALTAFEHALVLSPKASFAEDAWARLALARHALGDERGCATARREYMARYPHGVHVERLQKACPAP